MGPFACLEVVDEVVLLVRLHLMWLLLDIVVLLDVCFRAGLMSFGICGRLPQLSLIPLQFSPVHG